MTPSSAALVTPPKPPPIATVVVALWAEVETANVALVEPAGIVTLAGTVAAPVLLLTSGTTAPPGGGAGTLIGVAVPVAAAPPATVPGLTATDWSAGAGGVGTRRSASPSR